LKNYGRVIEDCLEAIKCDEKFVKPYFRACQAYQALEKYDSCIETANSGLAFNPKNKDLETIKSSAEKSVAYKLKKEKEREERRQ